MARNLLLRRKEWATEGAVVGAEKRRQDVGRKSAVLGAEEV